MFCLSRKKSIANCHNQEVDLLIVLVYMQLPKLLFHETCLKSGNNILHS